MIEKSSFIILRKYPFGENGVVLHVFAESLGRIPILVKNAKSKRSSFPAAMHRPLAMVEAVLRRSGDFYTVNEARLSQHSEALQKDPLKTSVSFFLADVWSQILKEEGSQPQMYHFLQTCIQDLCTREKGLGYFHLWALLRTSHFLGFSPGKSPHETTGFFDLMEGVYLRHEPLHPHFLDAPQTKVFSWFSSEEVCPGSPPPGWNNQQKREALQSVIRFFRIHVESFRTPVSLEVLGEIV
jgi:DNA repair protein RecO (recombination protein O)